MVANNQSCSGSVEKYKDKKIAILSPVAWRTPPRAYGAWETVASNIAEGLVERGWDVTLFATKDSITKAKLRWVVEKGYEEDESAEAKVCEYQHISFLMENANKFDLIHNNFDFAPLTYSSFINTPLLTTIHGFSSPEILKIYRKYKNLYYTSISDSDRDSELPYLATVYNGIDLSNLTFRSEPGKNLVFLGRIHPDKGTHLAIEAAKKAKMNLIIAGIIQDQNYFDKMLKPFINDKDIKFIGPADPIQRDELFKEALALLHLNTIPERFGLVIAESMAAGVPVIAMDLGSPREIIIDKKTGFLVNDTDEAAAAVKQIGIINRSDCLRHVEQNFTIECMVKKYEQVYAKIFELEKQKAGQK